MPYVSDYFELGIYCCELLAYIHVRLEVLRTEGRYLAEYVQMLPGPTQPLTIALCRQVALSVNVHCTVPEQGTQCFFFAYTFVQLVALQRTRNRSPAQTKGESGWHQR